MQCNGNGNLKKSQVTVGHSTSNDNGSSQQSTVSEIQTKIKNREGIKLKQIAQETERELCEEDVDTFLEKGESGSEGEDDYTIDKKHIPEVGMQFKTREEAQNFSNSMHLRQVSRLPQCQLIGQ